MMYLVIIGVLLVVGCTHHPHDYDPPYQGSLGNDSWQYGNYNGDPPRRSSGTTSDGGSWQDLGGGMILVQPSHAGDRGGQQTIILQ